MLMSKADRRFAELAAEWMLAEYYGCVHTRRALRTKFAKVDFFASDVMGMKPDGLKYFVQATAGGDSAVSQRRKKLEKYSWDESDTVLVAVLRKEKVGRSYEYFFIIHQLLNADSWAPSVYKVFIPKEWFKMYRAE